MKAVPVITAEQAAGLVKSGQTLLVGGFGMTGNPVHLVHALAETDVRELTYVANNVGEAGLGGGRLLRNGQLKKAVGSYFTSNREAVEAYQAGRLDVQLIPQGSLAEALRAGGAGLGGFYTPTAAGTVIAGDADTRILNGQPMVFVPALRGDVAFVRAWRADRAGNLQYRLTEQNFNRAMATAADLVIAEVEEIVEVGEIAPEQVHTPGLFVDYLVQATLTPTDLGSSADVRGGAKKVDDARLTIARRALRELRPGDVVNLGIGIPTLVADLITPELHINLHTENGMLGVGPAPEGGGALDYPVNAGKIPVTALPGAIMNSVTALDKFLAGLQALNPAYRQWKKNQLEIATLSREGMGQKKYGNWLENPYYDVLKEDADNREKLANARPLQKLGWWLFGGAPQVMSDEAAKAKSKAGVIFNDFASGLSQVLEQSLIDAAESGKYEDVGKAVNKWMRGYVRQMTLQAILAKSNLKNLIEKLADDVANGTDITNDQAAIEAEVGKITDQWKTVATKLEDEAKSIFEGLGDDIGSSVEDALMAAWEDGDWTAAEDKLQAKLNRFVASMALRALMATSKMKELVAAYITEYEAGGDTSDELAAINSEMQRLTTQWQGMAPGLPGYGAGQKAPAENPQDTRRRNETLWQYENAADPAEKEKYRKELLGMDGKSSGGSGGPVAVVTLEAAGPDYGALTTAIRGLSDRAATYDQAAQLHMKAAERQMEAANIQLQAASLLAVAAQGWGGKQPIGPGFINF